MSLGYTSFCYNVVLYAHPTNWNEMCVAIERRSMTTAIFSFDGRLAKQRWWPRFGFNTVPNLDFRFFSTQKKNFASHYAKYE